MTWDLFIIAALIVLFAVGVEILITVARHSAARSVAMIAAFGIAAFPVAIGAHNLISVLIGGDEAVSFILALFVAPAAITAGVIGLAITLSERARPLALGFALVGAGLVGFIAYSIFTVVLLALTGTNPGVAPSIDAYVLSASLAVMIWGAVVAGVALVAERDRPIAI